VTCSYAFFTGCQMPIRQPHVEYVTRKIMPELGVELVDVKGFTCCPEPVAVGLQDRFASTVIAARNIAVAEAQNTNLMTTCNGCYFTLKHAIEEMCDEGIRAKVNELLAETGHTYKGTATVKHFAQVLRDDVGIDTIRRVAEHPLTGLNVAAHTGCHFSNRMGEDAKLLDTLIEATGARSILYEGKNLCCGWTLGTYGKPEEGYEWLKKRLDAMKAGGADCITVICPQCLQQFDMGQLIASRKLQLPYRLPALFYLQLLGVAMGHTPEEMQLPAGRVKDPALDERLRKLAGA
jgi:heterodisulfide reductase subunit B2